MDKSSENLIAVSMSYRGEPSTKPMLPSLYIIEPTNVCNYRCVMCPNQYYKSNEKGYMEWDLFTSIIDQIADVAKSVQLYWVGESTLHPRLPDMIQYVKQHSGANTILSTNASILNEQRSEMLIESGLDELIIALDANSSLAYEKIRVLGKWDEVVANVESYFAVLGNRTKPKTIMQLIRMHQNDADVNEFIGRWSQYPCEPLITWFDTWAYQFPYMQEWSDSLCPNKTKPRQQCAEIWFKMVVNWRGEVTLCCHDWSSKKAIGDLKIQSVEAVWNCDEINQIRHHHQSGSYEKESLCKNCFEWSTEEEQYEFFQLNPEEQSKLGVIFSRKHRI